jgi:glycosyltransferase involved in cell wall biosynthesis
MKTATEVYGVNDNGGSIMPPPLTLRICHIINTFEIGGAETMVLRLARKQVDLGNDVSVYTLSRTGPLESAFIEAGVNTVARNKIGVFPRFWQLLRDLKTARFDVVHCHNIGPTMLGAMAARLLHVPSIISTWHSGSFRTTAAVWQYALASWPCNYVVAVSAAASNVLRDVAGIKSSRVRTIYNGIDPLPIEAHVVGEKHQPGFDVLWIGRLAAPKDPLTLIHAFSTVVAKSPLAHLKIVGSGPLLKPCQELAVALGLKDRITFLGERNDVTPFLAEADVFVLSSMSEGTPIALLEAMWAGLPCVVTRVGGMPEIVRPEFTVPVGNAADLATVLLSVGENPTLRKEYGRFMRSVAKERFGLDEMTGKYADLYPSVARKQRHERRGWITSVINSQCLKARYIIKKSLIYLTHASYRAIL